MAAKNTNRDSLPINITGPVGAVQTGDNAQAVISQTTGAPLGEVSTLIGELRDTLEQTSESTRIEAAALVKQLEENPRSSASSGLLESLSEKLSKAEEHAEVVGRGLALIYQLRALLGF